MSFQRQINVAAPSAPPSTKNIMFVDTVDGRYKQIDANGVISIFSGRFDRNVLMNGGFDIIQRVAAALTNIPSPSSTNRIYTADRWAYTVGNTTTPQFQQVDTLGAIETGLTARYYGLYKQLTNGAKVILGQVVEANATAPLRGRNVRFQCKLRYITGSNRNLRMGLLVNTGTADAPTAGWISVFNSNGVDPTFGASLALIAPNASPTGDNGTVGATSMQCAITTSWQRFGCTFLVPTTAKNIIPVIYTDNVGTANDDILISEVGLYDGNEIQDWIPVNQAIELDRCQRFFYKSFAQGTVPAQSVLAGAHYWADGVAGAASGVWTTFRFPVRMVKAPTITFYNPAAANAFARMTSGTPVDTTATSATSITDSSFQITATPTSTAVVGSILAVNFSADADL